MPCYELHEVDGTTNQDTITRLNALCPEIFPALSEEHLADGFWWLVYLDGDPIAFAGMVQFKPFESVWYYKRCYVLPDHHGHGLQFRLMKARELKARQIGARQIISECAGSNTYSASNFRKAGFELTEPEQKWGAANSLYWVKAL